MTVAPSDPDPLEGAPPDAAHGSPAAAPWLELAVVGGAAALAAIGVVGLALALLDHYATWAVVPFGVVAAAVAVLVCRPALQGSGQGPGAGRSRHLAAAAAVLLAAGFSTFAALVPSQNVVVTRDPGSYQNTAVWLTRTGSLQVDPRQRDFEGIEGLRFSGAAVYEQPDGSLQFQFNHLSSVVLAAAHDLGGHRLLFRTPALAVGFGLLAVYAVAARVVRNPFLALVAPAVLAACMPFLYVARNTYSEPFALALLWPALLLGTVLHRRPRMPLAAVLGLVAGALVCVRVDALLYVALACPLVAASVVAGASPVLRRRRLGAWAVVGAVTASVTVVGWIDLSTRSGGYASDLAPQLAQLRLLLVLAAVASAVGALLWTLDGRVRRLWSRVRGPVALCAALVVVAGLSAAWLLRPLVQEVTTGTPFATVAVIQERAGLPLQPDRVYHEYSLWWMAWYLGVVGVAAGIVGYGASVRSLLRGAADPAVASVTVLGLGAGALYWWNPSITPDHLWAMRRFIPAILPALVVMSVAALGWLLSHSGRLGRWRVALAVAGVAALVVPPALTTWPLRAQRDQGGHLRPVLDACDAVGDDGAIIVIGSHAALTLPQTLRSWCGVPVAAQGDAFGADSVEGARRVAARLAAQGRTLYLVTHTGEQLYGYLRPGGPEPIATSSAADLRAHEPTLDGPPRRYRDPDVGNAFPSPFTLHLLRVEAG